MSANCPECGKITDNIHGGVCMNCYMGVAATPPETRKQVRTLLERAIKLMTGEDRKIKSASLHANVADPNEHIVVKFESEESDV